MGRIYFELVRGVCMGGCFWDVCGCGNYGYLYLGRKEGGVRLREKVGFRIGFFGVVR